MALERPLLFFLVLAPLVLLTLGAARRSAVGLTPRRFRGALALRLLLLLCLGGVLADARMVLPHDERAVVFCLDVSESIDPAARRSMLEWTRAAWAARRPGDRAGLVVFGGEARVEAPLAARYEPGEPFLEGVARQRTALERGLRVAAALVRAEPSERRVVLLSDGNGDPQAAEREALALASSETRVTTVAVPLRPSPREVLLGRVSAPPLVSEGEAFLLKVEVVARSGGPASVHVVRNGEYLQPQRVELTPGLNRVSVPQRLDRADVTVYEVLVEAEGDGDPANNRGGAIVRVRGRPKLLLVLDAERDEAGEVVLSPAELARPLGQVLRAAGFEVELRGPEALPLGADDLAAYAALVFGNVSAERWSPGQMDAVRRYVFDQGGGLVALGGQASFGLGGYYKTPIEEALPVSSDVRGKKVLPSLALVLCIDCSGSMDREVEEDLDKLTLAKEGASRTVELLQPFDRLGVVAFADSPQWTVEPRHVEEPAAFKAKIRAIEIAGGTRIAPALTLAQRRLAGTAAQLKHVVLLTDGRSPESQAELARLLAEYRQTSISLTTVGIGSEIDRATLEEMAKATGGRFLWAQDARTLPRILSKEAVAASRALLIERRVVPRHRGGLDELGIDWETAPPLRGYVLTQAKDEAEVLLDTGPEETVEDGPILTRWRYGLGKAVAFSSDATARWCGGWLRWSGYAQLFAGILRWAARSPQAPGVSTELELSKGRARVRVRVETPEGSPRNGLNLRARLTGPPRAGTLPTLALRQTAPGTYEAEQELAHPGAYFATVEELAEAGSRPVGSAGAVQAYPREYRDLSHDAELLRSIAETTGGEALSLDDAPEAIFAGPREVRTSYRPLAPYLLVAAGCLLLLELSVRRLIVPETLRRSLEARRAARRAVEATAPAAQELVARLKSHKASEREASARRREPGRAAARPAEPRPRAPRPPAQPPARSRPKPPEDDAPGSAMSKLLKAKREARERKR